MLGNKIQWLYIFKKEEEEEEASKEQEVVKLNSLNLPKRHKFNIDSEYE